MWFIANPFLKHRRTEKTEVGRGGLVWGGEDMGGIRLRSGLIDLILVPLGRLLRVPVDKIRLHAVCRRPKCQRDLYPPVF
jgi:hypothetical protein